MPAAIGCCIPPFAMSPLRHSLADGFGIGMRDEAVIDDMGDVGFAGEARPWPALPG
jgi:hypothetical protein